MRREVLVFCLIGAGIFVSVLAEYGWIPDPEPDAPYGGPPEFVLGVLFAIIAFLLPRAKPQHGLDRPVRIWRRATALVIDWYIAGFSILAAYGLGGIALSWIRPEAAGNLPLHPLLTAAMITIGVSAFFSYFWLHPKFGRATLGQYILGYRIESDPDPNIPPHHFVRTVMATVAACSWHLWVWFVNDRTTPPGTYWWDRIGQTRAVFVGPY
ncbi:MAG: RDD family protein [Hyphomonas sp.]|nr:RDD family protein [Hyphomonas sp.]